MTKPSAMVQGAGAAPEPAPFHKPVIELSSTSNEIGEPMFALPSDIPKAGKNHCDAHEFGTHQGISVKLSRRCSNGAGMI
jgi:hypothetical protein